MIQTADEGSPEAAGPQVAAGASPREIAFRLSGGDLRALGLPQAAVKALLEARPGLARRAEDEWAGAARLGIAVHVEEDVEYPAALADLPDPPVVVYVRGRIAPGVARVAIVGSRRATAYGRRVASGLASALAVRGAEIVSGGARGIDTCAHRSALEAGGTTLAVAGSGLERPYPPENQELFERIAGAGGVLSEFPLAAPPRGEHFPRRNRLISALAAAVVVVEAAGRSGSLVTAGHALEQGREVMAVPGPVTSDLSDGCHRLIQQGAKLVRCADDVVEELPPMYRTALRPSPAVAGSGDPPRAVPDLSADEAAVAGLLDDPEPVHIDRLAEIAPFGIARLQAALLGLVLRGAVDQLAGGYYLPRFPSPGR